MARDFQLGPGLLALTALLALGCPEGRTGGQRPAADSGVVARLAGRPERGSPTAATLASQPGTATAPGAGPPAPPSWMRTASLEGRVDLLGAPLAGATLSLELILGTARYRQGEVRSDGAGRFRFARLLPGASALICRGAGIAGQELVLWVEAGRNVAPAFRLSRGETLGGRVKDDRGRPVRGARVQVRPVPGGGGVPVTMLTDGEGRFQAAGIQAGTHPIEVSAASHQTALEPAVAIPGPPVTVKLVRLYRLRGQVQGARRGRARLRIAGSGLWPSRTGIAAADGRFALEGIPAGIYELRAWSEQAPWAASEILTGIEVGPEDPAPVVLPLRPAQPLGGVVQHGEKPVAGATLTLGQGTVSVLQLRAVTDAKGRFALEPVVHGTYRLNLWASGYLPLIAQEILVPASAPLVLRLARGAAVSGVVEDPEGHPVERAVVWVTYRPGQAAGGRGVETVGELGVLPGPVPPIPPAGTPSAAAPELSLTLSSALTDGAGRFSLAGLQPGPVQVISDHPDFARGRSASLNLAPDAQVSALRLVLGAGGTLAGRVLDDRGSPLAGAQVVAKADGGERLAFSDPQGAFRFTGLGGTVELSASREGYAPAGRRVQLAGGAQREVDLVLEPASGRITGRVTDPRRMPVAGARVSARVGHQRASVRTDVTGFFELRGVGRRPLKLRVEHPGHAPLERTVRPGEEVALQLSALTGLAGSVGEARTGAPVTRYTILLESGQGQRRVEIRHPRGRFALDGLAPGPLQLEVVAPGFAARRQSVVLRAPDGPGLPPTQELQLTLDRAGAVEGQVIDALGQPRAGLTVRVGAREGMTAADGHFKVEGIPEGRREVEVHLGGGRVFRADPLVVRPDEIGGAVRIVLPAGW